MEIRRSSRNAAKKAALPMPTTKESVPKPVRQSARRVALQNKNIAVLPLKPVAKKADTKKSKAKSPQKIKNGTKSSVPQFLPCPWTGDKVWIMTATLQDLKSASIRNRKCIFRIASNQVRLSVYEHAAPALEQREQKLLPNYGGRPWTVQVKIQDPPSSPFFRWHKGHLELAAWPMILHKIPDPPKFPGHRPKLLWNAEIDDNVASATTTKVEPHYLTNPRQRQIEALQHREVCGIAELAYQERWRAPLPHITIKWISPLRETFHTRKSAWDRAVQLCQQECLIDKVFHGIGRANGKPLKKIQPPTRKATLEAGRHKFIRDGLWVVGQEEAWQMERLEEQLAQEHQNSVELQAKRKSTGLAYFLQCRRKEYQRERLRELNHSNDRQRSSYITDFIDLTQEQETNEETPERNEKNLIMDLIDNSRGEKENKNVLNSPPSARGSSTIDVTGQTLACSTKSLSDQNSLLCREQGIDNETNTLDSKRSAKSPPAAVLQQNDAAHPPQLAYTSLPSQQDNASQLVSFTLRDADTELRLVWKTLSEEERQKWADRAEAGRNRAIVTPSPPRPLFDDKHSLVGPSSKWRLNDQQIRLCYDAGVSHFNQIMLTVKARDLTQELADGFDLLRERGRFRYDMELPTFDTDEFDFLTNIKKAPWMPIVKEILGNDVVLIHKGIFLSLPNAEAQGYHQDGPHLTTHSQRPCHAINVFIPLVDLTTQGTEFCLGSHILGYEDYDRNFLYTPRVQAGTPIIFDYRLGHRGLANSSSSIRPVVYCSYTAAANGKEFRDSINFSRKRYRPIGDLVDHIPTREERLRKRERMAESREPWLHRC